MPISSEELSRRLRNAYPLLKQLRRAAIELNKVGNQIRGTRNQVVEKPINTPKNKE